MTTAVHAIAFKAQSHPGHRFQNLYGMLGTDLLYQSWGQLNKQAAAGIDGMKMSQYREQLPAHIERLSEALARKRYRASPVKRVFIAKANGKQRPLGLPTVDDKLVQQGVSEILQSIWEQDFLRNSYGYRPNRSAHQAVKALEMNLQFQGYGYVVEADIKGFFNHMDHDWLLRMLKQRIDDKALLGLIGQWLKAKVILPEGNSSKPDKGTPQGGVISPVLANIYLHYALDLWFEKKVKPRMMGRAMLVRYADDFVVAFQMKRDAERFYEVLPKRLNKFGLEVAPEKTHMKRFSRFHPGRKRNFQFLGFEFYWDRDNRGNARLRRRTAPKKQRESMNAFRDWIKHNRSMPLGKLMLALRRKLMGFRNYFGLADNSRSLSKLHYHVVACLHKWLNRRSQRKSYTWAGLITVLKVYRLKQLPVRQCRIAVDWY